MISMHVLPTPIVYGKDTCPFTGIASSSESTFRNMSVKEKEVIAVM